MGVRLAALALAAWCPAAAGQAATVHDEAVSGDAAGRVKPGTVLGTLAADAVSAIFGAYDAGARGHGDEADEQDSYTFSVLQPFTVNAATLSGDPARYSLWAMPEPVHLGAHPAARTSSEPGPRGAIP